MITHAVPGFLPSASGFAFPNRFPRVPVRRIGIPGIVSVPIGDASNGLCGGMAFAVRDYFEAGSHRPGSATRRARGRCSTTSSTGCSTASTFRSARPAT